MISDGIDRHSPRRPPALLGAWLAHIGVLAVVLDAWVPLPAVGVLRPLWIDGAAVAGLAWWLRHPGARDWKSPFDGRLLAVMCVVVVQAFAPGVEGAGLARLHQMIAGSVFFIALVGALRAAPRALEGTWAAIAVCAVLLGAGSLFAATRGTAGVSALNQLVDSRWAGDHGILKAMLFATLVIAGRAWDPGDSKGWRVAALLGTAGCAIQAVVDGLDLSVSALTQLNDPFGFSFICVLLLLVSALGREAWHIGRERADQAARWRALALGLAWVAALGATGPSSGGEGLRILAMLGAALVVAGREMAATGALAWEAESELGRAA